MNQQGNLFAPKPQDAGEGKPCKSFLSQGSIDPLQIECDFCGKTRDDHDNAEGQWCVAVWDGARWWAIDRDHRFMDATKANEWAWWHPHQIMGRQWRVYLVEELGK